MVYTRKVRKVRPRRRLVRRRRYVRKQKTTANLKRRLPNVFPDRVIVKLPYIETGVFDTDGGASAMKEFRINSIWDPDFTGTGHSALGHGQWYEFYNQYRVFAITYQIMVASSQATAPPAIFGWYCTPNAVAAPIDNSWYEQKHCRKMFLGAGVGNNKTVITGKVRLPLIAGQTATQYKCNEDNASALNTNPQAILHGALAVSPLGSNSGYGGFTYYVKLVYHCELFDSFQLQIS